MVDPAATTTRSSSVTSNVSYIKSPPGILKILEIMFGLLCWPLTAAIAPISQPHQFVMFVSVTSWILTMICLIIFLLGLHATSLSGFPWSVFEFCFNLTWAVLYFIAFCVSAAYTHGFGKLVAATVFAFLTTAAYTVHAFISFREWKGAFPWQSTSPNVTI